MMRNNLLISARDVKKHFDGGEIKALDGISTDIYKGEVVVVIGPSGSGKSTFLRCLNLLEVPTGGHILFDNVDITDPKTNINLHRRKMGMVFQHFNLFPSYDNTRQHDHSTDKAFRQIKSRGGRKSIHPFGACRSL